MKKWIVLLLAGLLLTGCTLPAQGSTKPTGEAPPMDAETVFRSMYQQSDALVMELFFSGGSSYGPYTVYTLPKALALEPELLTEIEAPELSGSKQWLVISAEDGSQQLTVYEGKPNILRWQEGGGVRYYRSSEAVLSNLRKAFDLAQKHSRDRISFFSGKSGKAILDAYGEKAMPDYLYGFAPDGLYRTNEYVLHKVKLDEKKGKVLVGTLTYGVRHAIPEGEGLPFFGQLLETDDGWSEYKKQVILEHQADGQWHEVSQADFDTAYTEEFAPYTPPEEPNEGAQAYLKELPQRLEQLRDVREKQDAVALAEAFLQTSSAVTLAGKTDFDWTVFCAENAMRNTGIQAFLRKYVTSQGAEGYFDGYYSGVLKADTVILEDGHAMVGNDRVRIWMSKTSGYWRITDISVTGEA